jgi:hypothetical protein
LPQVRSHSQPRAGDDGRSAEWGGRRAGQQGR